MAYAFTYKNNSGERTEVFCRNVATKNPDAALQFEIQQERGTTKRTYYFSFCLPATEITKFLSEIQRED